MSIPQDYPSLGAFAKRHLGIDEKSLQSMLTLLECKTLEELIDQTIPQELRYTHPLNLPAAISEEEALAELKELASRNELRPTYLGMGYHGTHLPAVIRRNILENPGWYTSYTPYQAEIAQGRLEALLNFQTMISDLTGLPIANASLLDEATAAAEAMAICFDFKKQPLFFVERHTHPQTIALLKTRCEPLGVGLLVGTMDTMPEEGLCGALIQYPSTTGEIDDLRPFIDKAHAAGGLAVVACDPLAMVLLKPPGEMGADIAIGSTQRFGIPLGYGGPHAAFMAVQDALKRRMPGRLIGVSRDMEGNNALRLSLQTREQHIRREKATSNICTAQVLLAVMASMYAVYHGPKGLTAIAKKIHEQVRHLAFVLSQAGWKVIIHPFFDTVEIALTDEEMILLEERSHQQGVNLRFLKKEKRVLITLDETTSSLELLYELFQATDIDSSSSTSWHLPKKLHRTSSFLTHPVFNSYHSETEMLRYLRRLEAKDLSLTTSMIPLGSCTMKLNATSEMLPISWNEFSGLHPFVPLEQARGYQEMFRQLERWLAEITGFYAISLQPNAGSQGEYAGLLAIRAYHRARGDHDRKVCLIPLSAHGTNPASASMVGMEIVGVACDIQGNIDLTDLKTKIESHQQRLAALMVTYPSTHGVFEASIKEVCQLVHEAGGQVYMDGANMNAQVGLCRPYDLGADVCHLNLHKTFCIPHGGGGPGVGPIGVAKHLAEYLPGHSIIPMKEQNRTHCKSNAAHEEDMFLQQSSQEALLECTSTSTQQAIPPLEEFSESLQVSAAPWGSASICAISWMYIRMMGPDGLTAATKIAILNANYIAKRLEPYYVILYRGEHGRIAHECILDLREWKQRAGIEVEDVAKRLIDYGFHAPTMSWPVPGTLMVEPTESESKEEIDRFCEAMIAIAQELVAIEQGVWDRLNNPLKNAPHTAQVVIADNWDHPYSRTLAAYPAPWLRHHKFWPSVSRIDNVYGDRNLFCSCQAL
ncbi:MAG: aminomethyl-transferring glycine dehydrogenase [Chthoniobacterales bacterium]|nr:aminomethyl-transferring glycine dehydrogenase [Chthoniobacterales bacterium]